MYLGLLVGANPRKDITWKPLLDTLAKRLNDSKNMYFLWGGTKNESKIAWVSWGNVCKPKNEGGLGIRDLRYVNLALLGKWRWRLLDEGQGIWRYIILARYESMDLSPHLGGRPFGGSPLRVQYLRLFQASQLRNSKVQEMGEWENGQWVWDLVWRRELFVWEVALFEDLLGTLNSYHISDPHDTWVWKHDATGTFSVKSAYTVLESSLGVSVQSSSYELPKLLIFAPFEVISFKSTNDHISMRLFLLLDHSVASETLVSSDRLSSDLVLSELLNTFRCI
ncbi:hypothetical protein TSUD_408250 [Trifolium subterraneum]|uniref:Uncharacterized protein n=1 Tax=Trifolium subterraneum TaxID=3900 RepID=A0A2Z6P2E1_TRISU|nr:hypothetical protein TSUD_408250 [Trifolium subterraneum]